MNFTSINIQGNILSLELFNKIRNDQQIPYQSAKDFGFKKSENLRDQIGSAWSQTRLLWSIFQKKLQALEENDYATSETRKLWMVPFLMELGFNPDIAAAETVAEKPFPISHRDHKLDGFPILIMGYRDSLDHKPAGNRLRMSPHALIQEYLNHTEHLYGIITNGQIIRILRDSNRLAKLAFIEFDLERMMEEELYNEFALMFRILHASRMPQAQDKIEESIIEQYHQDSIDSGSRIRDKLRRAVKKSMEILANGFIKHPQNANFKELAKQGDINPDTFYKLLLRVMYRIIFIATIEERDLVFSKRFHQDPKFDEYLKKKKVYSDYYSIERLRKLSVSKIYLDPSKQDLWQSLLTTFRLFEPLEVGEKIGIQPLGGELFASYGLKEESMDFYHLALYNKDFLTILGKLTSFRDDSGTLQRVNYRDLDVEELGSVYEALLELHPYVNTESATPHFAFTEGSERKLTGSYYTRHDLVAQLIKTALFPVIEERLTEAKSDQEKESALLEIKVCDPAAGSGHFLIAASRALGFELAKVCSHEENPGPEWVQQATRDVIQNCIYGVDRNPAAVELCRISLWLIGHNSGKPLTFLEHKIKCGDSLIGVDSLDRLKDGIPEGAFKPITGDDNSVALNAKNRNRQFLRTGQRTLFAQSGTLSENQTKFAEQYRQLNELTVNNIKDYKEKEANYRKLSYNPQLLKTITACNLFTYAFYQAYSEGKSENDLVTSEILSGQLQSMGSFNPRLEGLANAAGVEHRFFHWPLEFPDVFERDGFDVILGNPPWDVSQLNENEFFITRNSEIAKLSGNERKDAIADLSNTNKILFLDYINALRLYETQNKYFRSMSKYKLIASGKINLSSLFAALSLIISNVSSRIGIIIPSGIATDKSTHRFFKNIFEEGMLKTFYEFENNGFFTGAGQGHMVRFCLLSLSKGEQILQPSKIEFLFKAKSIPEIYNLKFPMSQMG